MCGRSEASRVGADSLAPQGKPVLPFPALSPLGTEESRGVHKDRHAEENNLIMGALELEERRASPVGLFRLN